MKTNESKTENQFKRKVMNQTWENGEKPIFGHDFGSIDQIWTSKFFFRRFYLYYMLGKFQGNLRSTQEKAEKSHFGPDLGPLGLNLGCQIFFFKNLAWSVTRYDG